jgi:mRNA-degrading endonuclease HigB of HigAB toxin-antitoxin module
MKVNVQPPSLEDTMKVQSDGSILLNVSHSNYFAPGELQFLFSFKIDGKKAGKDLGFDEASKKIPAYLTRALSNGGTFYIKGTFDRPEFHYVGDPEVQEIEICAKAKDSMEQESAEKCRTITFTNDPNLGSASSFTVGGTVAGLIGTVILQNNGGDDLTINSNGSFTFATEIIEDGTYDVTVLSDPLTQNCTILNGSGTMATSNITNIIVTCGPKAFTLPFDLSDNISPDGSNAGGPVVAMDDNGNAIIAWYQLDGGIYKVYKSEYRSGAWTHPASINDYISLDGSDAYTTDVKMDNNGNAIILWSQSDGIYSAIYKSEYRAGVWTHPADPTDNLTPDGGDAYNGKVAMDDNGNAIIIWYQSDGASHIFKSEYRSGSWTHPADITDYISPVGSDATDPQVVMDNNGNAIIAWQQSDGAFSQIFKSEYRSGSWTHPADPFDNISPDGSNAFYANVAMDNNGNTIIFWSQDVAFFDFRIFKSEYRSGSWTHPVDLTDYISPDATSAIASKLAMDDNGNAILTWHQPDGSGFAQIFKSEYRSGSWTHPIDLSDNISPDGNHAIGPMVAMDNNGNSIITWYQMDGSNYQIFRSEYRSGVWAHPVDLSDNLSIDGTNAANMRIAMDNNDDAIIVWQQSDGTFDQIFISEYR